MGSEVRAEGFRTDRSMLMERQRRGFEVRADEIRATAEEFRRGVCGASARKRDLLTAQPVDAMLSPPPRSSARRDARRPS